LGAGLSCPFSRHLSVSQEAVMTAAAALSITETRNEGLLRSFQVSVPASRLDTVIADRLVALNSKVRVPGFRPGKVPLQILRARYGDSVQGEALQDAVRTTSAETLQQHNIKPALQPSISVTRWAPGESLEYTLDVELLPEIPQVDLSTLTVASVTLEVPESRIEEAVTRLVESNTKFEPLPEAAARPAQTGDQLTLDFTGRIDGVEFSGGKAEGYKLCLGKGRLIPGFEEQVAGMAAGETRDITVTFPTDYSTRELAGKEAVFTIVLHTIEQPVERLLDDALAEELGYDDLAGLRNSVTERLTKELAELTRPHNKRRVLDVLDAATDFDLPPTLVKSELHTIWHQVHDADGKHSHADDHEHILPEQDTERLHPIAVRRVKLGLVLADIGTRNNVTVNEEEVRRAIWREAMNFPGQAREVLEFFQKNPGAINNIRAPLFEDKVIDFILAQAKVETATMTAEAFEVLSDAEEKAEALALGLPIDDATATATDAAATSDAGAEAAAHAPAAAGVATAEDNGVTAAAEPAPKAKKSASKTKKTAEGAASA
jgi:trigger factor